jgi:hypothetical protein
MKNKKYTFGDVTFEIEAPFEIKNDDCEAFQSEREADYFISVLPMEEDQDSSRKVERVGNVIKKYIPKKYFGGANTSSLLASSVAAFTFLAHDAFILHASYVVYNGRAILFTAPSGTGKTTQAQFWAQERGAEIVNGDRVLITRRDDRFYANGIYVSGTSGICKNITVPIGAVVLLEQGECNMRIEISARMLFLRIMCECSYDMSDVKQYEKLTELVSNMITELPTVCYSCKKSPDAVDELERILWKKK